MSSEHDPLRLPATVRDKRFAYARKKRTFMCDHPFCPQPGRLFIFKGRANDDEPGGFAYFMGTSENVLVRDWNDFYTVYVSGRINASWFCSDCVMTYGSRAAIDKMEKFSAGRERENQRAVAANRVRYY